MRNIETIILISHIVLKDRALPNVGLASIASYCKATGYNVDLIDSNYTDENYYDALKNHEPTLVGITCEAVNLPEALKIARRAKKCGHITVLGGIHVTLIMGDILQYDDVDYGIYGDGEVPLVKLAEALNGNGSLVDVPRLMYRTGRSRKVNAPGADLHLDALPLPDYTMAGIKDIFCYPIATSRGCSYKCSYCSVGNFPHGTWKKRSPENVVAELVLAKKLYKPKRWMVVDENFSHDTARIEEMCKLVIKKKIGLPWTILEGVRADKVNRHLLTLLKKAGCRSVNYGIESADASVFNRVNKGEQFDVIERAIDLAHELDFTVLGYFILGLPGATFESDMKSFEYSKARLDQAVFWMAIPYYGTPFHRWVTKKYKLLREPIGKNVINGTHTQPFFEPENYPIKDLKWVHTIAYRYWNRKKLEWFRTMTKGQSYITTL